MTLPFVQLIHSAFRHSRAGGKRLVLCLLCVTVLLFCVHALYAVEVERYHSRVITQESLQEDRRFLEGLVERRRKGEEGLTAEIAQARSRVSSRLSFLAGDRSGSTLSLFFHEMGAIAVFAAAVCSLLLLGAFAFPLCSISLLQPWPRALRSLPGILLPMITLTLLVFASSFLWIPALGILLARLGVPGGDVGDDVQIAAVLLGYAAAVLAVPRLILSPVLLVQEGLAPLEALRRSIECSAGHWSEILWNMLLLMALLFLCGSVVLLAAGALPGAASLFALSAVEVSGTAFASLFLRELLHAVLAHAPAAGETAPALEQAASASLLEVRQPFEGAQSLDGHHPHGGVGLV